MQLLRLLLIITASSLVGAAGPGAVLAHPLANSVSVHGQWTGLLPVPGGSRQVSFTVEQRADGTMAAVLHAATTTLHNTLMRVLNRPDSVVFYADNGGVRFAGQAGADGQQLRGQWQQPGFRATLVLNRVQPLEAAPAGAKRGAAPAVSTAAYTTEEVRVSSPSSPNSEIGLGGSLSMPLGAGPFPAVVLLADVGAAAPASGAFGLLDAVADYLTRHGLAVLRLDERGQGRSVGVPAANTGTELVADAQSALHFLRTHANIDPLRVGVLGHGEGANVALLAAAQTPAPAFLVALGAAGVNGQELLARQTSLVNQPGEPDTAQLAWARKEAQVMRLARREAKQQLAAGASPAQVQVRLGQARLRLQDEARKRSDALFKRQYALLEIIRQTPDNAQAQAIAANMLKQIYPALPPAAAQTRAGQLTSPWYRSCLAFNPQAELGKVGCPALLLHGTADTQVPAANLSLLEKGLKANKQVNSQRLDGLNHSFQTASAELGAAPDPEQRPEASEAALEAIREWVQQQVRK